MESSQIPRALPDLDFGILPGSVVYLANMDPEKSILSEDVSENLELVVVVSKENKDSEWAKAIVDAYKFDEFKLREEISKLDKAIGHIKKNKRKYMALVTIIALTVDLTTIDVLALAPGLGAIDAAGTKILELVRRVGYWIGIILCSKDVLKHISRGHTESIGAVVAVYGMGYGVLYFLPWLFDLIKSIF